MFSQASDVKVHKYVYFFLQKWCLTAFLSPYAENIRTNVPSHKFSQ